MARLLIRNGRWDAPDFPGDAESYDSIAFNIWRGRGFGGSPDDPEWRAPYVAANTNGIYDGILAQTGGFVTTAYRAPAFPFALASVYALFGRSFLAGYALNIVAVAAAIALATLLAFKLAGRLPAVVVATLHSHPRYPRYPRLLLFDRG